MAAAFDPAQHPRQGAGAPNKGWFAKKPAPHRPLVVRSADEAAAAEAWNALPDSYSGFAQRVAAWGETVTAADANDRELLAEAVANWVSAQAIRDGLLPTWNHDWLDAYDELRAEDNGRDEAAVEVLHDYATEEAAYRAVGPFEAYASRCYASEHPRNLAEAVQDAAQRAHGAFLQPRSPQADSAKYPALRRAEEKAWEEWQKTPEQHSTDQGTRGRLIALDADSVGAVGGWLSRHADADALWAALRDTPSATLTSQLEECARDARARVAEGGGEAPLEWATSRLATGPLARGGPALAQATAWPLPAHSGVEESGITATASRASDEGSPVPGAAAAHPRRRHRRR